MAGTTGTDRVVVVGCGPTGLLLAGDLAEAGVPVTVLEKRPRGISNLTRAFALHARTLEQLDMRGLADELEALGHPLTRLGLFDGLTLDLSELPTRFAHVLVIPQYEVERVLERRAREAGAEFRYDTEVTGLTQDATGVTVRARGTEPLRAAYVVGADGMRSAVREAVGLPFPGRAVIRSVVLADVRLAEDPPGLLTAGTVGDAFALLIPFGDGYHRVIGWHRAHDVSDDAPLDLTEIKDIVRLALGRDFGMHDPRWLSRFHSDERQAPTYRAGRVFLAGDAAHVHSPAGGQGMNTGLQDAANLSWKLAAVLSGRADPSLLDTYDTERHPVGRTVLRSSGTLIRLAMADRPWTRALRSALTTLVTRFPALRRKAMHQVTGLGYSYGPGPLTGRRAPDIPLPGNTRLYEALRPGDFVLLTQGPYEDAGRPHLTTSQWPGPRTLLIRPDGYIAWAAKSPPPTELEEALLAHVGPPA
ncbi:FAD-dependent monooxygenase [Streptomyces sp. NPDC027717]|uniref:FAD-dependent monooxygenase n=1 Tax=Streptomyces sp. NPDC027717 TaxID=3155765 RepID=UPI0033FBA0FF